MSHTLIAALVLFVILILLLVTLLLLFQKRLIPQHDVTLTINGEQQLLVPSGGSLSATLAARDIYLPSACGGKGSCGQCRCQVLKGGGSLLPTETAFFTRQEAARGWHLGCQLKVRQDLDLAIPPAILDIKKWDCEVVSNRNVSTFIKEFKVRLPEGERLRFRSGEYVQIDIPPCKVRYSDFDIPEQYRGDWQRLGMLGLEMQNSEACTRAYSLANHPVEDDIIMLNVRIATPPFDRTTGSLMKVRPGVSSSYIWSLKAGDHVQVSGPYGDFHIKDTDREMIFVGGGAGMAPMRSHIFDQLLNRHTERRMSFWYGGRSLKELFYMSDFERLASEHTNFTFHVALSDPQPDDGWTGATGFIHQVLFDQYLSSHTEPEEIEYYLCGPGPMTSAVVKMLDNLGVPPENIMFDDFGS